MDAAFCVSCYREWLDGLRSNNSISRPSPQMIAALRGKDLVCWCPLASPCHADVLLELANSRDEEELPEWWRQQMYPGITPEMFAECFTNLEATGWDEVRSEVEAITRLWLGRAHAPALPDMARVYELLGEFGLTYGAGEVDTDTLKHRLEDQQRWNRDILSGELVEASPPGERPDQGLIQEAREHADEIEPGPDADQTYDVDRATPALIRRLADALASRPTEAQAPAPDGLLREFDRLRWRNILCGSCGGRYRECRSCGKGTDSHLTCREHQKPTPCAGDCPAVAALAAPPATGDPR